MGKCDICAESGTQTQVVRFHHKDPELSAVHEEIVVYEYKIRLGQKAPYDPIKQSTCAAWKKSFRPP